MLAQKHARSASRAHKPPNSSLLLCFLARSIEPLQQPLCEQDVEDVDLAASLELRALIGENDEALAQYAIAHSAACESHLWPVAVAVAEATDQG